MNEKAPETPVGQRSFRRGRWTSLGGGSEFAWDAEPGEQTIMTRATDTVGNTQPDHVPFDEKGYLFNQPLPHPIRVT